jgi:hypothetical protein
MDDQQNVAPAVARKPAPGIEVSAPAVAGAQLLDRGADQLALGGAAGFALLIGEGTSRLGHQGPPVVVVAARRSGRAAWSLPCGTPARACHPSQGQRAARAPGHSGAAQASPPSTVLVRTRSPWAAVSDGSARFRPSARALGDECGERPRGPPMASRSPFPASTSMTPPSSTATGGSASPRPHRRSARSGRPDRGGPPTPQAEGPGNFPHFCRSPCLHGRRV